MKNNRNNNHLKYMVFTALFAALICVMTAFVHIPTNQGYIHAGDGIIFLAAAVLPAPYAMLAGAIGAGFSDYLSGYAMWVLPTMIIKAASAAVFSAHKDTIINKRNIIALIPAAMICIGGYYLAGAVLAMLSGTPVGGAFAAALADVPSNGIQCVCSAALFLALGKAVEKTGIKKLFRVGLSET